jgi:hypothetical protein
MNWYWYVSRDNEIFCDLDSKRAVARALDVLRRAMRRKMLAVDQVFFYPSLSNYHLIVTLKDPMESKLRVYWSLWMGSDRLRAVYTLERIARKLEAPDLLIPSKIYIDGFRLPDHVCHCPAKHKARRITNHCPVLLALHGSEAGAEYFPRSYDRKPREGSLLIPWGNVPKKLLKGKSWLKTKTEPTKKKRSTSFTLEK